MLKLLLKQFRLRFFQLRLKAQDKIYRNLTFHDLENESKGMYTNGQILSWRLIYQEQGSDYVFYETVDDRQNKRVAVEPARQVFLANDAGIFSSRGVVYNIRYNCAILETVESWGNDSNFSTDFVRISKKPSKILSGLSFSLLTLGAHNNYAHFLFDSLTKLGVLKKLSIVPDRFLVPGPPSPWKLKALNFLAVDNLEWVTEDEEVFCEQLLFTSRVNSSRHITPFAVSTVRQLFLARLANKPSERWRIIFAARTLASARKTSLEDLLTSCLPNHVEVIEFESLGMHEAIKLCQESILFFGFHGAAFSNILFCEPGTQVVELQLNTNLHDHNRNYYQVACDVLHLHHKVYQIHDKMSVDDVKILLDTILGDVPIIQKHDGGAH
jgi:hypothetical protein